MTFNLKYVFNIAKRIVQTGTQIRQRGQGMTEYIILVGFIAIGSMFVISKDGEAIKTATGNIVNKFTNQSDHKRNIESVDEVKMKRDSLWSTFNRDNARGND